MSARSPYVVLVLAMLAALLVVGLTAPTGEPRSAGPIGGPPSTSATPESPEPTASPTDASPDASPDPGPSSSGTSPTATTGPSEPAESETATGSPGGTGSSGAEPLDEPDPIDVRVVTAPERAVTRTLGDRGGRLQATGADGATYPLEVPAGAIATGIPLTMTPVQEIEGVSTKRLLGAVSLDPTGLVLARPATLTVEPAGDPAPVAQQIGFATGPEGADFHLTALSAGAAPTLRVHQLGTLGAATMNEAERVEVGDRLPEDSDARVEAQIARVLLDDAVATRTGETPGVEPELRDVLADHQDAVVEARLRGGLPDLAEGMSAVADAFLLLERYDAWGLGGEAGATSLQTTLRDRLAELVERAATGCADASLRRLQYLLAFDRLYRQLVDGPDDELSRLVDGCARFRVDLTASVRDGWAYTSPGEAHRLAARWRLRARATVGTDGAWTAPLTAVGYRYAKTVRRTCSGGSDRVSRWDAAPVARQPEGRVRGRVVIDRNVYRGGIPESGSAAPAQVEVRVVRLPEQRVLAATYAGCAQAVADRYATTQAQFADRFDVLFDTPPAETVFTAQLRKRPGKDGTLARWSGKASSTEPGIDRATTGLVTLRLQHVPDAGLGGLSG